MTEQTDATQPKNLVVKMLQRGRYGGKVVKANVDFATGGPFPDETHELIADAKRDSERRNIPIPTDLPDPTYRNPAANGERFIGDIVRFSFPVAVEYLRTHVVGFTDETAAKAPVEAAAFMSALADDKRLHELPKAPPTTNAGPKRAVPQEAEPIEDDE